jgi:hypothetical protein
MRTRAFGICSVLLPEYRSEKTAVKAPLLIVWIAY